MSQGAFEIVGICNIFNFKFLLEGDTVNYVLMNDTVMNENYANNCLKIRLDLLIILHNSYIRHSFVC